MKFNSKFLFIPLVIIAAFLGFHQYQKHTQVPEFMAFKHAFQSLDGRKVNLRDSKADYLLVSYFQTWCKDCVTELPSIMNLQKLAPAGKIEVFMISDEEHVKIERFKTRFNSPLNFYYSESGLKDLGIQVYPTTYLVDKSGKVMLSKLEGFAWDSEPVRKILGIQ